MPASAQVKHEKRDDGGSRASDSGLRLLSDRLVCRTSHTKVVVLEAVL